MYNNKKTINDAPIIIKIILMFFVLLIFIGTLLFSKYLIERCNGDLVYLKYGILFSIFAYIAILFECMPNKSELNNKTLRWLGYKNKKNINYINIPEIYETKYKYLTDEYKKPENKIEETVRLFIGYRRVTIIKEYITKYFITSIGDNVFKNCINLKYIKIPKTIKKIGKNAFNGCTGLFEFEIPKQVKIIGENAFSGCTGLFELKIPKQVKIIGENAFLGVNNVIYNGNAKGSPWGAKKIINPEDEN